jgi:hypothetical protein
MEYKEVKKMSVRGIIVLQHITQLPGVAMVLVSVRFQQSFFTSAPYKHVKTAIYSIMGVEKASNSNDRSSRTDSFSLRSDAAREREIKLRWEEKDQNLSIN